MSLSHNLQAMERSREALLAELSGDVAGQAALARAHGASLLPSPPG